MGCTSSREYTEDSVIQEKVKEEDVHERFLVKDDADTVFGSDDETSEEAKLTLLREKEYKQLHRTNVIVDCLKFNHVLFNYLFHECGIKDEELRIIASQFSTMKLFKDKIICHGNGTSPSTYLYILETGSVSGRYTPPNCRDRRDIVRSSHHNDSIFGEVSFLSQKPRDFTYITESTQNVIHFISHQDFTKTILKITERNSLEQFSLFSAMSPEDITKLSNRVVRRKCAPGEILIKQGDPPSSFFIVASGFVKLHKDSDIPLDSNEFDKSDENLMSGKSRKLSRRDSMLSERSASFKVSSTIGRDGYFGEESLVLDTLQPATFIASHTGAEVFEFNRITFEQHMMPVKLVLEEHVRKRLKRKGSKRAALYLADQNKDPISPRNPQGSGYSLACFFCVQSKD